MTKEVHQSPQEPKTAAQSKLPVDRVMFIFGTFAAMHRGVVVENARTLKDTDTDTWNKYVYIYVYVFTGLSTSLKAGNLPSTQSPLRMLSAMVLGGAHRWPSANLPATPLERPLGGQPGD